MNFWVIGNFGVQCVWDECSLGVGRAFEWPGMDGVLAF